MQDKNITMHCPICGNDLFLTESININGMADEPDDSIMECYDCKAKFTKAQLIDENKEIINANIDELVNDAKDEIMKRLYIAFANNK